MSPTREKRFLRTTLRRIDDGPLSFFASRWAEPIIWVGMVLCTLLGLALVPAHSRYGAAALFVLLGFLYASLTFMVAAAKGWPILTRFIDRQAIVDRLRELGA